MNNNDMYISSDDVDDIDDIDDIVVNTEIEITNNTNNTKNTNELFVVIIINGRYVRWESFSLNNTIMAIHNLLVEKYNIGEYIMETDEYIIPSTVYKYRSVAQLCSSNGCSTIHITTKNRKYKLLSNTLCNV